MSSHPLLLAKQRIAEKRAAKAVIDARIAALNQESEKSDLAIAAWEEVLRDLLSVMPGADFTHDNIASGIATILPHRLMAWPKHLIGGAGLRGCGKSSCHA